MRIYWNVLSFLIIVALGFKCGKPIGTTVLSQNYLIKSIGVLDTTKYDFKSHALRAAILNHNEQAEYFYENLEEFDIDPFVDQLDTNNWNVLIDKDSIGEMAFLKSKFYSIYPLYANKDLFALDKNNAVEFITPLLKDTFHFGNKIIHVKKAKSIYGNAEWKKIKKNRFFGQAIYDNNSTQGVDDDKLTIVVHVKKKIDIAQVLVFIIYHEYAHFVLGHASVNEYDCKLSYETDADCFAASVLRNHNAGGVVIGATSYAFKMANHLGDVCHDNTLTRANKIMTCAGY